MSTKRTNKKMLAARVLCTLLLGTYLVGGYGEPVAWGADNEGTAKVAGVENDFHGIVASAWGAGTKAYGRNSTSFGANTVADGHGATAFGGSSMALGFCNTAWGYATQAGQLLYGSDKKVAYIVDYKEGETTKYKIVDYNSEEKKTLKDGFNSYWDAYSECEVKDVDQATAWGSGAKATDWHATAFGFETIASGKRSTAFGQKSEASGESATAWGGYFDGNVYKGGTASGTASTAFGVETEASGFASTAFGSETTASGGAATAFGAGAEALGIRSTAFGAYTMAGGPDSTAFGVLTKASGQESTAFGTGTKAIGLGSTAFGANTKAGQLLYGTTEVTIKSYTVSGKTKYKIVDAFYDTTIKDDFNTYWQAYNDTDLTKVGAQATAFGQGTEATGDASTAFGDSTTASGEASTAWGNKSVADGKYSTAFGDSSQALAENSLAALGGITETAATNSAAIGKGATVKVADAVALGSGSVASREAGATDAYLKTDSDTGNAWVSTHNAIAVGDDGTVTRQITGVAAGSKDTDAVNVAQLKKVAEGAVYTGGDSITIDNSAKTVSVKKDGVVESGNTGIVTGGTVYTALQNEARVTADGNYIKAADSAAKNLEALDTAVGTTADGNYVKASDSVGENLGALDAELAALTAGTGAGLAEVSHRIDNVDSKVEKVGAGAAALAALHPLDTDGKFSMAAGFGNYRSANAMALGLFYRPTDQVMFSMGGSMGNGENLLNVGVSFALDKGVNTSKAAMAKKINVLEEENKAIRAENAEQKAEIQELKEALARIEAKLAK